MPTYQTEYGPIYYGGSCEDDYPNLKVYDQPNTGGTPVVLQAAAMRAFKRAEERIQPRWIRRLNSPREHKGFRPILLTGSHRSCSLQARLYASDPNRFAHPNVTGHTRGICIDVSTAQSALRLRKIRRALLAEGWHQVRPDDEPWHWSFHVVV